ncbi:MAG: hypothetical protein WC617_17950 [Rhodanobacter sp.]|jgi:hypothetical protein
MAGSFFTVLAGCALSLIAAIPGAQGREGLIHFSGRLVAPTCASVDARSLVAASSESAQNAVPQQFACTGAHGAIDVARSYTQTVTVLSATNISGDGVLAYFAGYASVANHAAGRALLVTRTFQ